MPRCAASTSSRPRCANPDRAQDGTEINARDFQRARKDRETRAHLPNGTLVAIAGGRDVTDPGAVFDRLDRVRARHADMVLVHDSGAGSVAPATPHCPPYFVGRSPSPVTASPPTDIHTAVRGRAVSRVGPGAGAADAAVTGAPSPVRHV